MKTRRCFIQGNGCKKRVSEEWKDSNFKESRKVKNCQFSYQKKLRKERMKKSVMIFTRMNIGLEMKRREIERERGRREREKEKKMYIFEKNPFSSDQESEEECVRICHQFLTSKRVSE